VAEADRSVVAEADRGVVAEADGGVVAEADGGVVAEADGGVVAEADGGVVAEADGGVVAEADGGVVAEADGGVVAEAVGRLRDATLGDTQDKSRTYINSTHLELGGLDRGRIVVHLFPRDFFPQPTYLFERAAPGWAPDLPTYHLDVWCRIDPLSGKDTEPRCLRWHSGACLSRNSLPFKVYISKV
jgi:hypothetical protein